MVRGQAVWNETRSEGKAQESINLLIGELNGGWNETKSRAYSQQRLKIGDKGGE